MIGLIERFHTPFDTGHKIVLNVHAPAQQGIIPGQRAVVIVIAGISPVYIPPEITLLNLHLEVLGMIIMGKLPGSD